MQAPAPPATKTCLYCQSPVSNLESEFCCASCESLHLHVKPELPLKLANEFSHLDQENFRDLYKINGNDYNYLFHAEGLHCSSCVHTLEKLPEFYSAVKSARVNFAQSTVAIQLDEQGSLANTAQIIKELGYNPSPIAPSEDLSAKYREENRNYLKRIAVAGFCAGNTMLFVIPVYSGLAGEGALAFNWISFLLFLPILFYSAVPFYKGALSSLRYRVLSVDLPITIALVSSFLMSTYNLIKGSEHIYFDSTATFMFFILSARFLLKRVQQKYLSHDGVNSLYKGQSFAVLGEDGNVLNQIPFEKVQPLQQLRLYRNQRLPADGVLVSETASLDMSLINGESLPKTYTHNMPLQAGGKILNEYIDCQITQDFAHSHLGQTLRELESYVEPKGRFLTITDKLAQGLIASVFVTALIFFAVYSTVDVHEAFNRSLALIVLACPCALAFGTPLTYGLALRRARERGIIIKDSSTLERILKVKNLFFDKTGTLTEGQLSLLVANPPLTQDQVDLALALERLSFHPIAFAIRRHWKAKSYPVLIQHREILGEGVEAHYQGHIYSLKRKAQSEDEAFLTVEFKRDNEVISQIQFTDQIREDAKKTVQFFASQKITCHLLSGDRLQRAVNVGLMCGIPKESIRGDLLPLDKRNIIVQHENACMIGDGANDALSLQAADVGVAMSGSVDMSLASADVFLVEGGLSPMRRLYEIALKTRAVLVRNLSISLVYNVLGGIGALLGFINPLMAAILMPISSFFIIFSSLWGFRK